MDKKFRSPRVWSNRELRKFSADLHGKVVNASGWMDSDKEGGRYKEYFTGASEYWITNYKSEARGFQGSANEIFLDLTLPLDPKLQDAFDVVFNHTVLEHIFEVDQAFSNLCSMSRDIVVVVVPFLQEQHAEYGDYWRFTPQALDKLFSKNGMEMTYLNYNDAKDESIYLFAIGTKSRGKWEKLVQHTDNKAGLIRDPNHFLGKKVIGHGVLSSLKATIRSWFQP